MQGVLSCLRLLTTSNLLLLSFVFLYSGLETSFWAGAFPSSVSFTLQLASRKMVRQNYYLDSKSIPKSGDGSLQRDGSCWLNLGRGRTHRPQIFCQQSRSRTGRLHRSLQFCFGLLLLNIVVSFISGLLLHSIAFLGCLLFLPHPAPLGDTPEEAFLEPRFSISFPFALCCSFSITFKRRMLSLKILISHPVTGLRFWLWSPCCLAQGMLVSTLRHQNKITIGFKKRHFQSHFQNLIKYN